MTERCLVKSKNNCHLSSLKTSEVLTLQASTTALVILSLWTLFAMTIKQLTTRSLRLTVH